MFLSDLLLDYFANMVIVLSQNGRGINARMHTHRHTYPLCYGLALKGYIKSALIEVNLFSYLQFQQKNIRATF